MTTLKLSVALVFGFLATIPVSRGWDNPGHMAIAGLAYDELSSQQQKNLANLIRKHPGFNLITESFPDPDIDDRDLVMAAATWPDLAKQDTKHYHHNGYEKNDPPVTHVEYSTNMHKGYHFVDTPYWVGQGPAPSTLPDVPRVNATNVVNVLLAQLKNGEPDPAKAYDLGWLLHLVGDIHQPLHAVTGVSELLKDGDTGGNAVRLTSAHDGGVTDGVSDLHSFWDDILGKSAHLDSQRHARLDEDATTANEIIDVVRKLKLPASAQKLEPALWANESFNLAKRDAYSIKPFVSHNTEGDEILKMTLTEDYRTTAVKDARKRIRVAGHRLALLLKQIL